MLGTLCDRDADNAGRGSKFRQKSEYPGWLSEETGMNRGDAMAVSESVG